MEPVGILKWIGTKSICTLYAGKIFFISETTLESFNETEKLRKFLQSSDH